MLGIFFFIYRTLVDNVFFIILICSFILFSCNAKKRTEDESYIRDKVEQRVEFQKVVDYYSLDSGDSLKLKAAEFLISNLERHFELRSNDTIRDSQSMSSLLLIENIECAFKAWAFPWSKHLDFESFCEYILPYRFGTEQIESWRPIFMEEFEWLLDSMGTNDDPLRACELISSDVSKWFKYSDLRGMDGKKGPSDLLSKRSGNCTDEAAIVVFAMRSMGIPVTHELVPSWGFTNKGHDFNAVLSKSGEFLPFTGKVFRREEPYEIKKAAKVYRRKFSKIKDGQWNENELGVDVTKEYVDVSDVEISLSKEESDNLHSVFLCVFSFNSWMPISKGVVSDGRLVFRDVGMGILYLAVGEIHGEFKAIQSPFLVEGDGKTRFLKAHWTSKQTKGVIRKPVIKNSFSLTGGVLQASEYPDFRKAIIVHSFGAESTEGDFVIKKTLNKPYRFWRLFLPDSLNFENEISEIEFINGIKRNGDFIGDLNSGLKKLFDGDTLSFARIGGENGSWAGVDLKKSDYINEIKIRFWDKYLSKPQEENSYELFYHDDDGWRSLGNKKGGSNYNLQFNNLPIDALFYLKNLTKGTSTRPFTLSGDTSIFW